MKLENKKLKAHCVLPEPFTGEHWIAFQQASRESDDSKEDRTTASMRAALVVIESGQYEVASKMHDLKADGMATPFSVLFWMAGEVDKAIAKMMAVPKN